MGVTPSSNDLTARELGCGFWQIDAHFGFAQTPNVPLQGAGILPSVPGLERSRLPTFLSLWQTELTMERLSGR